jgi:mRNA interferase RelE/StbE
MAFSVKLKRSAEKELENLPARIHDKVINILLSLKENPLSHNSKKLHGREAWRIRVRSYRILYHS